jgi:hypothetical protein
MAATIIASVPRRGRQPQRTNLLDSKSNRHDLELKIGELEIAERL